MLLLFGALGSPGEACHAGSLDVNSAVIIKGLQNLVCEKGCGSLWGSSGLYFEHRFLDSEGILLKLQENIVTLTS